MSAELIIFLVICVFALVAHGVRYYPWLSWLLRIIIGSFFIGELYTLIKWSSDYEAGIWNFVILAMVSAFTGLSLIRGFRVFLSYCLSFIEQLVSGQLLIGIFKKRSAADIFFGKERTFYADSMPHLVGFWVFVTTIGFLLGHIDLSKFGAPDMNIPIPIKIDYLFSSNLFGLVLLAVCGVGIFVSRKPRETLQRLGLVKPRAYQVGLGILMIFVTFGYDALAAEITHRMPGKLGTKLNLYNSGTFVTGGSGDAGESMVLSLATAFCAGIGEETLMRGAVTPALGIVPAGILHGMLHEQFADSPVFIIQVAIWSCLFGILRKYTNTTTTIIGHAGFNLISTFLFAFNP